MKNTLIIIFFILNFISIKAQYKNISGIILNTDSTPGMYMLVSFESFGKTIKSTQTDSIGKYNIEIELPPKGCIIKVSNWGNTLYQDTVPYTSQDKISKDILLQDFNTIEMNEVVVQAVRNGLSVKGDKLVYVPKESLLKSNNVFDVLKQTPLIQATDNAVSIISKNGTLIYINGKEVRIPLETLIEHLKTMPADNLKDIQIITNPGAEYLASSTGGIINITLKKNFDEGFFGQVTVQGRQGRKNSQYISSNLRYRKGNFGIDGTASLSNNNSKNRGDDLVEMKNTGEGQYTTSKERYRTKSININLNTEYELNEQHSFNLLSMLRFSKPKIFSDAYTNFYNVYTHIVNDTTTYTDTHQQNSKINSYFFNLSYVYRINDEGQKLALSTDYMDYEYNQHQYTSTISLFENVRFPFRNIASYTPQKIKSYSFKADYTLPFGKNSMNVGAYYSYNQNKTSYNEIQNNGINETENNRFIYDEYLTAGYLKFSRILNDILSTSLGLRIEHMGTRRDLQSVESDNWKENKFNLFPSFNLNYKLSHNLKFNYSISNKVVRPNFWALRPSKSYITDNLYVVNNPFLKNEYITSFELQSLFKDSYYFTIGYYFSKDELSQFLLPDNNSENTNYFYLVNYGNRKTLDFTLVIPYNVNNSFISGNITPSLTYNKYNIKNDIIEKYYSNKDAWNYGIDLNNTFNLSRTNNLVAYLNIKYYSPFTQIYKKNTTENILVDIELKKIWDNWTISLAGHSLFGNKISSKSISRKSSPYLINDSYSNYDARNIILKINYTFGNTKTKKNRSIRLANDEIKNRVQ